MLKKMLSMITDALNKNPNSNIGKIFQVFAQEYKDINDTLLTMQEWTDLEKAEGKGLEDIGEDINQKRGNANDAKFRLLIRAKRARSLADGTINQMINALATTLNIETKEIKVQQLHDIEPASLMIETIPVEKIINAGMNTSEFETIIESLAAAGVSVYLSASGATDWLCLRGSSYDFPVNYRITSRFRSGKTPGVIAYGDITMADESYNFTVSYKICGRFRAGMRRDINGRNTAIVSG